MDDEGIGPQSVRERDPGVGDGGVGSGQDDEVGLAAGVAHVDGRRAQPLRRASGGRRVRTATSHGHWLPPARRERDRHGRPGSARADQGQRPGKLGL
jgi:hypothetical protein